jgi:hypothetical protein
MSIINGLSDSKLILAIVHRYTKVLVANTERIHRQSRSETARHAAETKKARKSAVDQI